MQDSCCDIPGELLGRYGVLDVAKVLVDRILECWFVVVIPGGCCEFGDGC